MSELQSRFYPESRFGGFTSVDGTIAFYSRVNALLRSEFIALDAGCGRGAHTADPIPFRRDLRCLQGKCRKVIGIDVDLAGATNPRIDEYRQITGGTWPVGDNEIDLCVSDHVLEHIQNPDSFFAECARILKPNGYLCIRTPNAWNYISLFSRLVPNRFHAKLVGKVQGRSEADTFATYFACNSISKLRLILKKNSFDVCVFGYEAEPQYHSFSRLFYLFGVLHQRFAPGFLKASLFAFARRRG